MTTGDTPVPDLDQLGVDTEAKTGRPTSADLDAKVADYLRTRDVAPHRFEEVKDELQDFADGRGDEAVRKQYYHGWIVGEDGDFAEVLKRLEAAEK